MQAVIDARGNLPNLAPINDRRSHFTLPVGDKTIIEHVVDGLTSIGVNRIAMVTDEGSLRSVFGAERDQDQVDIQMGVEINFVKHYHGDRNGKTTGLDNDEGFLWVRGDTLYDWDTIGELAEHDAAIGFVNDVSDSVHGRLEINGASVHADPGNISHSGAHMAYAYKFPAEAHEWDYGIDPMTVELADTCDPEAVPIRWTPMTNPNDYLQANLDEAGDNIHIPDSASVAESATIIGPCVLGKDVTIAEGAVVESAVLMDGSTIGVGSYVGHSVVAEGATVEQNVTTNTRSAGGETVVAEFNGERVDTGRTEFGAVFGPGSSVQAGVTLLRGTTVDSGLVVSPGKTL